MYPKATIWEIVDPGIFFSTKKEAYWWWKENTNKPWREVNLKQHVFFGKREFVEWLNA